jgi:phosphoribosylamine---glycine ligase
MERLNFLFVTKDALSLDLAYRLLREGHSVKMFTQNKESKDVGYGIVERVNDWRDNTHRSDVIVFDDIGFGREQDKLRKRGHLVFGGSTFGDRLEDERGFGQQMMKKAGIKIKRFWNFVSFEDAIEFIEQHPNRYVVKPNGEAEEYKEFSYVGKFDDGRDVIAMLEHFKTKWLDHIKINFQLQEFVHGVEVAVAAYFNGKDFLKPININFENKKLMNDGLGPNTGEMGTHMFWDENGGKIFRETLAKMKRMLQRDGYVGDIDINCIVNSSGAHPLEFTCRFGYPELGIELEAYKSNMGLILRDIAAGKATRLEPKEKWACGVVVAVPPWPYVNEEEFAKQSKNLPILGAHPKFHLGEVKMVHGRLVVAGPAGYVGVCADVGKTLDHARLGAYAAVKQIYLPNIMYRTDIGLRWRRDAPHLKKWGYIK